MTHHLMWGPHHGRYSLMWHDAKRKRKKNIQESETFSNYAKVKQGYKITLTHKNIRYK